MESNIKRRSVRLNFKLRSNIIVNLTERTFSAKFYRIVNHRRSSATTRSIVMDNLEL